MKVLLTLPPEIKDLEIYRVAKIFAPPLGLAYVASVLEKFGHKVRVVDTVIDNIGLEDLLREIRSWNPDVVGISIQTPTAPRAYRAIKEIKEEFPDLPIIAGGIHATFMYDEALDAGADVVVRGEGEYTALELVNTLEKHGLNPRALRRVKGIVFREGGDGRANVVTPQRPFISNLDELPWPAHHLLPMDKYLALGKKLRVAHIMASRGCPYGCIYCITSYYWGRRIRFRSAKNVLDEVEYLVDKYRINKVAFSDDELIVNRRFVYDFIKGLKERGLDVTFSCGGRVDHINRDYLRFLFSNGCEVLYLGVESASQRTIDRIGKRITIDQAMRAFQIANDVGIFTMASFILGFPWETLEDMKRTVKFAVKLRPSYAQFTALTPYPGTPLYKFAEEHNLIVDRNWEHYTTIKPVMRGFHFTAKELGRMLMYAYRRFYLRPAFIVQEAVAGRLWSILKIVTNSLLSNLASALTSVRKHDRSQPQI